jgi:signal transduction histidine kinase
MLLLAGVRTLTAVPLVPIDMTGVVTEALNRLTDLVAECQADVRLPEEWPLARGYAPWVEEVWVNYISNAVKFGGCPPLVELGATQEDNGSVRFWVRDNGPGLTKDEQTRLFRPFTRLKQVRAKGYGLGLSIARRIVEKLGGQIGVESQPGQGSVFSFTLPASRR